MAGFLVLAAWCVAACGAQFTDELQQHEPQCLGEDKFTCLDGGCIDRRLYCDFIPHCEDGSDENFCPGHNADAALCNTTHQFLCRDQRRCVPVKWLCNGESDCADGSDEAFCTPYHPPDEAKCKGFMCKKDDRCISQYWMCDGEYDCEDKSDEDIYESCLHTLLSHERVIFDGMICSDGTDGGPKFYACEDYSYCLNQTDMCNGLQDCRDGSDEGPFCDKWGAMCSNGTCGEGARCFPERAGPVCVCAGDTLRYNGTLRRCEDAGACAQLAPPRCSQRCLDEPAGGGGGFRCECVDGYTKDRLHPHLCHAEGSEPKLFFSTTDQIKYITLRTMQQVTVSTGHKQNHGVVYDGNYLYWTELSWGHQAVLRARLGDFENSKETIVSFGLEDPGDLAVDYLGGLLYITDMLKQIIGACTFDGKMCLTIKANALYPRFIALDVRNGTMFWSDFIRIPVIMYARMDGSQSRVLVANMETRLVSGLSVDPPSGRLYYVDGTIKAVRISDGKIYSLFKEGGQPHHPYATAVFENNVYWNDWLSDTIVSSDKIQNGTEDRNVLLALEDPIFGMHVYHPLLYTAPSNPCAGHKCSHFCLLTSNATHVCACPDGMELVDDTTCRLLNKYRPQYLVIGGGASFARLQHNSIALPSREATTFDIGRVQAMAYDSARDNLLVYDGQRKAINQIPMASFSNGVTALFFYEDLQNVVDMEYEQFSDLLYVLDAGRRVIEVVSMALKSERAGERARALVHRFDDHETPLSMCLLPDYGRIWVAISEQLTGDVHIDSLGMDGQGRYHMITTNLRGKNVRLRYSSAAGRVLISDEATNLLEIVKPDGSGRETLRRVSTPVADLATVDHLVFWTGRGEQRLHWADLRQDINIRRFDLFMFPNITHLHLLVTTPSPDPAHPLFDHPCSKNSTCTHFCVQTSNFKKSSDHKGFTCICPIGMIYDAVKKDCVRPTIPACRDNELYCRSSNMCYPKAARCDGKKDCALGEDELGCTVSTAKTSAGSPGGHPVCATDEVLCHGSCIGNDQVCYTPTATERPKSRPVCPPEKFACRRDGACVDRSQLCDGRKDCVDRSDEAYDICSTMTCMDTEFMCTPGNCILKSWRCDGTEDCLDGSDEFDCDTAKCAPGQFRCRSGECVDMSKRCDAQPDCGDGSDEDQCVSDTDNTAPEEKTSCSVWEYRCEHNTSICLPLTARCNRKWDCPDGTDESNCESSACSFNKQFTCARHRTCIDMRLVCNGQYDCADGTDETRAACLLKKNTTKLYTTPIRVEFPVDCKTGFRCKDAAQCIEWNLVCDGKPDCGDGSDESETCASACAGKPCSSSCRATPGGPRCECPAGYEPRGRDCVDVDECAAPAPPCSHHCHNTLGSYQCSCQHGYALRVDRHSCKAVEGGMEVLYASGNRVRTAPGEPHGPAAYLHPHLPTITDIAVDIRKNFLYVTSSRNRTLVRTTAQVREGSSLPIVVTNVGIPSKVSVDWITGNVYFVDETPGSGRIRVCHLDQRKCARLQLLPANTEVTALVVDPVLQLMFYCVRAAGGGWAGAALWAARLTGRGAGELTALPSCDGLALDPAAGRVYVAQVAPPAIVVRNYTGHTLDIEYKSDKYLKTPHCLQLFEDHIYYLDGDSFRLNRCVRYGRRRCEPYMSRAVAAAEFVVYHRSVQRADLDNQCWVPLCPNICTMHDGDVACICPDGAVEKGNALCDTQSDDQLPLFNGENGLLKDARRGISNVIPSVIGTLIMFVILFFFLARYAHRNNYDIPCTRFLSWCDRCRNVLRPRAEVPHEVVYRNIATPAQQHTDELVNQDGSDANPHEFANPFHHLVGGLWQDSFREQSNQDFGGGGGLTSVLTESPANTNAPDSDESARENLKKKLVF